MNRVQHAPLSGGDDHAPVSARCLKVGVERMLGAVHGEQAFHQVALYLGQAVLGREQALHVLLHAVPAEAGPEKDGEKHGRRGEEHRVARHEPAQRVEGGPQARVQHLAQHPSARPRLEPLPPTGKPRSTAEHQELPDASVVSVTIRLRGGEVTPGGRICPPVQEVTSRENPTLLRSEGRPFPRGSVTRWNSAKDRKLLYEPAFLCSAVSQHNDSLLYI